MKQPFITLALVVFYILVTAAMCWITYLSSRLKEWSKHRLAILDKTYEACLDDVEEMRDGRWRWDRYNAVPFDAFRHRPFAKFDDIYGDLSFTEKGARPK